MDKKINIAVAGLGFGAAFVPIYKHHPFVGEITVYDPNQQLAEEVQKRFGILKRYDTFEEILEDKSIDAVHLISPIPTHEQQSIQVLKSGKHCACTVPMALSVQGLTEIMKAKNDSGKNFMMMETSVYTHEFFHALHMLEHGDFGKIQFLKGAHYQDMEKWPSYWAGLPPMYYATHAIAPLVMLAGAPITSVRCLGTGSMREELSRNYGNPYPVETAIFTFSNGLAAEVTRSLFELARGYTESFSVYGDRASFEWPLIEQEETPVIHIFDTKHDDEDRRGKSVQTFRLDALKNHDELLPEAIRRFTVKSKYYDETNPQDFFEEGGGHGGSHPHLVNEFLNSIFEERDPWINERVAANITAAGICAHASAMNGGAVVEVPRF